MSTVAEQLRNARQAKSLSIEQVAEITKMRTDHVRALEEGDFRVFSAPVYARGSVRTYATLLKLDLPQVMSALELEMRASGSHDPSVPRPSRSAGIVDQVTLQLSSLDWRKAALVAAFLVILVLAAYLAWRSARPSDPLKNLRPGVYKPAQDPGQTLPLPGSGANRP